MKGSGSSGGRHARSEAGFSLIEMLVALVILALILAFLPGAFRLARQVWTAAATLEKETDRESGLDFLEARLAEAMPLFEPTSSGLVNIVFKGTSDSLRFIAPSQNGPNGGGLYSYSFELRPAANGTLNALAVVISPYLGPNPEKGSAALAEEQVLATDVASAKFQYFGRHELRAEPSWQPEWKRTNALPDLVELSISRGQGGNLTSRSIVTELRLQSTR